MVTIKYIGPHSRVIAGKRLFHDESMDVNEKVAEALRGDEEVVIVGLDLPGNIETISGEPGIGEQISGDAQILVTVDGKPEKQWTNVVLPPALESNPRRGKKRSKEISPSPQPSPAGRGDKRRKK